MKITVKISLTLIFCFIYNQLLIAQPSNDECSGAIDISSAFMGSCGDISINGPFTLTGSTSGTNDPPEPGENEAGSTQPAGPFCPNEIDPNLFGDDAEIWENSVWFKWTVPDLNGDGSSVTYSMFTSDGSFNDDCGITDPLGGDSDTQVAIYQGACPTAATGECDHYAANEDLFSEAPWISGWSSIQFIPGVTYYMGVDGWDGVQGEFCMTVTICGVECGNDICDPAETYCTCEDCQFDGDGLSLCDIGEVAAIRYDEAEDAFFFSSDLSGDIFFCSEFVFGYASENIYLAFGAQGWSNCVGMSSNSIGTDVSLSVGEFVFGATDNGDETFNIPTFRLLYIELTPEDIATGSISITSFVEDGLGNTCRNNVLINFADFPQVTDPYCNISCSAGGINTDLLDNGLVVCEGQAFTLSTNGLEDLTLPCNSDDGSSYVYGWRVLADVYGIGDYLPVTNFQILGVNPTINPETFFIDEFGYIGPYYTPGYPILPNTIATRIQAVALCINADGSFVDGCPAANAGYDNSQIEVTYLLADDSLCSDASCNPPIIGSFNCEE